jgi:hypothetical protein
MIIFQLIVIVVVFIAALLGAIYSKNGWQMTGCFIIMGAILFPWEVLV